MTRIIMTIITTMTRATMTMTTIMIMFFKNEFADSDFVL